MQDSPNLLQASTLKFKQYKPLHTCVNISQLIWVFFQQDCYRDLQTECEVLIAGFLRWHVLLNSLIASFLWLEAIFSLRFLDRDWFWASSHGKKKVVLNCVSKTQFNCFGSLGPLKKDKISHTDHSSLNMIQLKELSKTWVAWQSYYYTSGVKYAGISIHEMFHSLINRAFPYPPPPPSHKRKCSQIYNNVHCKCIIHTQKAEKYYFPSQSI